MVEDRRVESPKPNTQNFGMLLILDVRITLSWLPFF